MTVVLERIPVDEIGARAREIQVARTLLTLVAGFFWLLGFVARKVVLAIVWCCAAAALGWQDARRSSDEDARAEREAAELARLRKAAERE